MTIFLYKIYLVLVSINSSSYVLNIIFVYCWMILSIKWSCNNDFGKLDYIINSKIKDYIVLHFKFILFLS